MTFNYTCDYINCTFGVPSQMTNIVQTAYKHLHMLSSKCLKLETEYRLNITWVHQCLWLNNSQMADDICSWVKARQSRRDTGRSSKVNRGRCGLSPTVISSTNAAGKTTPLLPLLPWHSPSERIRSIHHNIMGTSQEMQPYGTADKGHIPQTWYAWVSHDFMYSRHKYHVSHFSKCSMI